MWIMRFVEGAERGYLAYRKQRVLSLLSSRFINTKFITQNAPHEGILSLSKLYHSLVISSYLILTFVDKQLIGINTGIRLVFNIRANKKFWKFPNRTKQLHHRIGTQLIPY
jgi:hypothetical protein